MLSPSKYEWGDSVSFRGSARNLGGSGPFALSLSKGLENGRGGVEGTNEQPYTLD